MSLIAPKMLSARQKLPVMSRITEQKFKKELFSLPIIPNKNIPYNLSYERNGLTLRRPFYWVVLNGNIILPSYHNFYMIISKWQFNLGYFEDLSGPRSLHLKIIKIHCKKMWFWKVSVGRSTMILDLKIS